jgi:hypothetical protein
MTRKTAVSLARLMRMPTDDTNLVCDSGVSWMRCKQGAAVLLREFVRIRASPSNQNRYDVDADLSKLGAQQATQAAAHREWLQHTPTPDHARMHPPLTSLSLHCNQYRPPPRNM